MSKESCPRSETLASAIEWLLSRKELDRADRILALDGLKRGLCNCFELCRCGVDDLLK